MQKGLLSPRYTYHGRIIQQHICCIPQLTANRRISQHRIHPLCIAGHGRSLEVLDELADAHQLAREAELLLGRLEGRDAGLGMVCAVEVPGEEAREVLEGAEDFVAADWGMLVDSIE
jgi:hypothetical protein